MKSANPVSQREEICKDAVKCFASALVEVDTTKVKRKRLIDNIERMCVDVVVDKTFLVLL